MCAFVSARISAPKGRVRRTILNHLVLCGYPYKGKKCRVSHGTIRRIDDTHVEVVFVQRTTSDGYFKLSAVTWYLKHVWRVSEQCRVLENRSTDPFYLGLLNKKFCVVLAENDSEACGDDDDVVGKDDASSRSSSMSSMPGDDERIVIVTASP